MQHRYIQDLESEMQIPKDGITSRSLVSDENVKAVLFGFDAGQELSEHTASMPAIVHILKGEAAVTLGGDSYEAKQGSWAYMPAGLPHSISAKTPVVMLLTMIKSAKK